jgi:hypothetical protein
MEQKYTVGHKTLFGMIHYYWHFDTVISKAEGERVTLITVLVLLAYTREIIESGDEGIRTNSKAIVYKDLKLKLL